MILFILIVVAIFVVISIFKYRSSSSRKQTFDGKIVILTAHPDDEVMFFAPTILSMLQTNAQLILCCVSNGNFENQGKLREKELYKCCKLLGIKQENIIQLSDDENFQDDPNQEWNSELLASKLHSIFRENSIKTIITFGPYGVSGHTNHRALYRTVSHMLHDYECFYLDDFNILRKYSSILNLVFIICASIFNDYSEDVIFTISHVRQLQQIFNAMKCHQTQLVWFRKLYMVFSSYIYVNILKKYDKEN